MLDFLKRVFTWWHNATIGTLLYTWRKGEKVGEDDQGNRYYRDRKADRRWVLYNGDIEASRIPPDWHRWLHRTAALPPTEMPLAAKPWEKAHQPNLTGTARAYYPPGSLTQGGKRSRATGDYEPWRPS